MNRVLPKIAAAVVISILSSAATAQTPEENLDQLIVATRPILSAGKVTGRVVSAHTADCKTMLTLDNGAAYAFDVTKSAVSMNKELMIGDGDDVIGLTYQGDDARSAASAVASAIEPVAARCSWG